MLTRYGVGEIHIGVPDVSGSRVDQNIVFLARLVDRDEIGVHGVVFRLVGDLTLKYLVKPFLLGRIVKRDFDPVTFPDFEKILVPGDLETLLVACPC